MRVGATGTVLLQVGLAACRIGYDPVELSDGGAASLDGARPGDGAASGDAAGTARPCLGTAHTLRDDFDDGQYDIDRWAEAYESDATFDESGGELVVTLFDGGAAYAAYESTETYDMTPGDRVFVELVESANTASEAQAIFRLLDPVGGNDAVQFVQQGGKLHMDKQIGAEATSLTESVDYDPVGHRWLQIAFEGGEVFFDASPDGVSWVNLGSAPSPPEIDFARVRINVGGGTYRSEVVDPGTVRWDNVNVGPDACSRGRRLIEAVGRGAGRSPAAELALESQQLRDG